MTFSKKKLLHIQQKEKQPKDISHTILIVDDEPLNIGVLDSLLKDCYHILKAVNGYDALQIIQQNTVHLILSDQQMPGMSGVDFLEQSILYAPYAMRIILTGYSDIDVVVDAINRANVYKFIIKPYDTHDLLLTIKRALESWELQNSNIQLIEKLQQSNSLLEKKVKARTLELEETIKQLREVSITDQLTGAYNRRKYNEVVEKEIALCKRYKQTLSMILFDIDFFKKVNDNLGHHEGDKVLQEVASVIKNNIRRHIDIFFRIGGEEFLILSPNIDVKQACHLAEKLRLKVANHSFQCQQSISISMGVVEYLVERNESTEQFFYRADKLMYIAKNMGRNRVICNEYEF